MATTRAEATTAENQLSINRKPSIPVSGERLCHTNQPYVQSGLMSSLNVERSQRRRERRTRQGNESQEQGVFHNVLPVFITKSFDSR
jgi:hypothetical protein